MPKLAWQSVVAFAVLFFGFWVVRCYGGSQYDRGRREAEAAHSDSVRKWVAHGADSASRSADASVTALVRSNDSLRAEIARVQVGASHALERERQAEEALKRVPKEVLDRADPRVRAALDSVREVNRDLKASVTALAAQNVVVLDRLVADSVAMRRLQDSRDRWKAAYDTASVEIGQLQALKTPKRPRFGFKSGLVTGVVAVVCALVAALGLSH